MKHTLTILLLLCALGLSAQVDNPTGGIAIPRSNNTITPTPDPVTTETPTPLAPPKRSFSSYDLEKKGSNFSMMKNDGFVSRAAEYEEKVNTAVREKGEPNTTVRENQFFGEIRTKSPYLEVLAADYGAQDGDRIRVLINGIVVIPEFTLANTYTPIILPLNEGFNKIDFQAMNQGTTGPNTAIFYIHDNKEVLLKEGQWALATGFNGTVMVIKE